jgi:hypothetical protein
VAFRSGFEAAVDFVNASSTCDFLLRLEGLRPPAA